MTVTLSLRQRSHESEYWDLNYDSTQPIAGFQFSTPNGTCEHSDSNSAASILTIQCGQNICLGWSFTSNTIPAGSGLFLVLHNKEATQLDIHNIVLSDVNGNLISTSSSVQGVTYADQQLGAAAVTTTTATTTTATTTTTTTTTAAAAAATTTTTTAAAVAPAPSAATHGHVTDLVFGELHLFDTTTEHDVDNGTAPPPLDLVEQHQLTDYLSTTSTKPIYVYIDSEHHDHHSQHINNHQYIAGSVDLWNHAVAFNDFNDPTFGYSKTSTKQIGYKYVIQIENRTNKDIVIDEEFKVNLCYNYVNHEKENADEDGVICPYKAIDKAACYSHDGDESYLNRTSKIVKACKSLYIGWTDLLDASVKHDHGNLFVNVNAHVATHGHGYGNSHGLSDTLENSVLYSHITHLPYSQDGYDTANSYYRFLTSCRISLSHDYHMFDVLGDNTTHSSWKINEPSSNIHPASISYNYSLLSAPNGGCFETTEPESFFNVPNSLHYNQPASFVNYSGHSTNWKHSNSYWAFINESQFATCGDPHIKALNGLDYDFRYEGYMRYFECDDLIINVECAKGDEKWENLEYFRKMYLNHEGKELILDLGFRGKPVSVLKNDGFDIIEKKLEINANANRFCGTCRGWKSNEESRCTRHIKKYGHNIGELVRNSISLCVKNKNNDKFIINAENVNKQNLQPCALNMGIKVNSKNIAGLAVSAEWVPFSILKTLNDSNSIINTKSRTIN